MLATDISKVILEIASRRAVFSANDVIEELNGNYTRSYVLKFVNQLLRSGDLVKSGSTRSARYVLAAASEKLETVFEKRYVNKNLGEDKILIEFEKKIPFLDKVPENIHSIFEYAFTEMVNNAIEHSHSKNIHVKVEKDGKIIRFIVDDFGIGIFKNIMSKRKLNSELEAIQDLLKGKLTTNPHAHSGEGIFFTSKVADVYILDSFNYELRVDNLVNDVFISQAQNKRKGTRVIFEISESQKGHLNDIFKGFYTDIEDLAFDKTEILIKLYTRGSIYVSRSQARRVLVGLDKFKSVILDFDKVPGVGQAFADEIFRVFKISHPGIQMIPVNMNDAVSFMVKRVDKPKSQ